MIEAALVVLCLILSVVLQVSASKGERLEAANEALKQDNFKLRRDNAFLRSREQNRFVLSDSLNERRLAQENDNLKRRVHGLEHLLQQAERRVIDQDKRKRLIMLCHPDKHGDSEMSKEITQWLMQGR